MKHHKTYTVGFRRKRSGKTDYKKRLKILLANKPRLVVRKSSKNIIGQVVEYGENGDRVLISASSKELEKLGWGFGRANMPCAYLVGFLIAKKAEKKRINQVVFDIGRQAPISASRVFCFLKGAVDGGLDVPHSKEVLPSEDRLRGKHIVEYAKRLKGEDNARYEKQFSACLKKKADPEDIEKVFDAIKKKIEAIK